MTLKTGVSGALYIYYYSYVTHIFHFFFFLKGNFFKRSIQPPTARKSSKHTLLLDGIFSFLFFSFGCRTLLQLTRADDIARLLLICDEPETSGRDVAAALTAGLTLGLDRLAPRRGPAHGSSVRSLSLSFNVVSTFCLSFLFSYSLRSTAVQSAGCCCSLFELSRTRTLYPQTTASLEQRRQFLSLPFSPFFWLPSYFWMPTLLGVQWDHLWRNNAYCRSPFDFW